MQFSQKLIAFVAALQTVQAAAILGFNYGATKSDGYTLMQEADFATLFTKAQNLVGTSGFNAARLYTSIQTGTTPSEAFAAAMSTNTKLLLGLWASSGSQTIENEINAIKTAISDNGSKFTDLVIGVSVGSEDLYRISPTGILNKENPGAGPEVIASYISQVKSALGSSLPGVPVGHVDTWTAWANSSNSAAAAASDFIGVDAYPYFQNTMANSIEASRGLFDDAISQVKATVGGKNIWITETGFPVSGPTQNLAVPSAQNAKAYWDAVGCGELFNVTNTFWYTLEDNYGGQLSSSGPSFGIVGSNGQELFDLSCSNINKTPASSASVSGTASVTDAGSPGATKLPPGVGSGPSSSGNSSSGSGSGSSSVSGSPSVTTSYTPMTTTNSAGVTITTSVASNITVGGGSGSSATPVGPTSSTTAPATGAGANIVAPVAGVFAAIMAAFAYL